MANTYPRGGNFFAKPHSLNVSFKDGVLKNRYERRFVALSESFLTGFLEGIEIECGEATDEVMHTCGREYGEMLGRHLDEDFSRFYEMSARKFPMAKFTALIREGLSHDGWGKLNLDYSAHDCGVIQASVDNAIYSAVLPGRGRTADNLLAGLLAGIFSYFATEKLDCVQTGAPSGDSKTSTFVIALEGRLDDARDDLMDGASHSAVVESLSKPVTA